MHTKRCGDANNGGNIALHFKGACLQEVDIEEAYRCTGCGGWFHLDCIFDHFQLEEHASRAHKALRDIKDKIESWSTRERITVSDREILDLCIDGLRKVKPKHPMSNDPNPEFLSEPPQKRCQNNGCKRYTRQQDWKTEDEKRYCFTCYEGKRQLGHLVDYTRKV